jgi:hypothetical protein
MAGTKRTTSTEDTDSDIKAARAPQPARWPRLLDDRGAAEYLGLSRWTIRDYLARGILHPVAMPPLAAREGERQRDELRRGLMNIQELDAFVDQRRKG